MSSYSSKPLHQHPALDEFAMMNAFDRRTLDIAGTNGSSTKIEIEQISGRMWVGCGGIFFFSPRSFLAARRVSGAGLFYWAASRHRLCLYWPVSRCAVGREGVSPDLPLPGWESTGRHSWAGVGEELAEGWKISVKVVQAHAHQLCSQNLTIIQ